MTEEKLALGAGFDDQGKGSWARIAEESLKGRPLAKLTRSTYDGIVVEPLYTREDDLGPDAAGLPGQAPYTRGSAVGAGWTIRQGYRVSDLEALQSILLRDLERGVGRVDIYLDAGGVPGAAVEGAPIRTLADLELVLADVREDLAPVTLRSGAHFAAAASLMFGLWTRRGRDASTQRGSLAADPIGAFAREGGLPYSMQAALTLLEELATHTHERWPKVRSIEVDGGVYHEAGATDAQELAGVLATVVAYLRALTAGGLDLPAAAGQIELNISVGSHMFADIAKLRAARRLFDRMLEACGVEPEARAPVVHATASRRVLTQRDPWVNMLRGTAACFGGALGGAESVTVHPFDAALGVPTELGARVARNTQVILQEESGLGRVTDPAGGSWYIEAMTDALARKAWSEFQRIEGAGGIVDALTSGHVTAALEERWAARAKHISRRRAPITGVSEFPNLAETSPQPRKVRAAPPEAEPTSSFRRPASGDPFEAASQAALAGTSLRALTVGLRSDDVAATMAALPRRRDAAEFEALRDLSDARLAADGQRPRILLIKLGSPAEHTARASWAKNFFEAGGIEGVAEGVDSPEAAAAQVAQHGVTMAALCSSDGIYEAEVERYAPALRAAGITDLFLAGDPRARREAYEAAGISGFVHVGCPVLDVLKSALRNAGASS